MNQPARTILITGAGSGLGRNLCACLAQQGHAILATDLHPDTAEETTAQIRAAGGHAQAATRWMFTSEESIAPVLRHIAAAREIDVLDQ